MSKVITPKQAPEYIDNKSNEVISVAEVKTLAVAYVNAEGRRTTCLAMVFGKNTEDGGPGVFILADEERMEETLTVAKPMITRGVRRWLDEQRSVEADEVPDALAEAVQGSEYDHSLGDKETTESGDETPDLGSLEV